MREVKRGDGIFMVNDGAGPAEIKAKSGPIIWRQLGGGHFMTAAGLEMCVTSDFKDSSHERLFVAVGGFAQVIVDTDGRTIAFGTGISTGERDG